MSRHLKFYGFSSKGYDGQVITIETDIRNGFPGFDIIGLPDTAIKESRDRIKTALRNCGFKFPQQRVLVSLSPASVPKSGSLLDLGIALSILFALGNGTNGSKTGKDLKIMAAGELTLSGRIIKDYSALGATKAAKKTGCGLCLLPFSDGTDGNIIQAENLTDAFLKTGEFINANGTGSEEKPETRIKTVKPVFSDIIGLEKEKKIITACAAGKHSILLFGPPGVGKTMLATRIVQLLPDLAGNSLNDVKHIYGCAGLEQNDIRPPLREISHDCSMIQFTGGLNSKSPGEGALAHCGVVLLDEITSYSKKLLESVKETYDRGYTVTSRSGELITYPASFIMAGTMNACACGKLGSEHESCICTSQKIISHWDKVGTPLLSRFDIRIPVEMENITSGIGKSSKPDSHYTDMVKIAEERQKARFKNHRDIKFNGQVHLRSFNGVSFLSEGINRLYTMLGDSTVFDTREILGIVSLARTLADIEDREEVKDEDYETALLLRKYGNGDYYWKTIG